MRLCPAQLQQTISYRLAQFLFVSFWRLLQKSRSSLSSYWSGKVWAVCVGMAWWKCLSPGPVTVVSQMQKAVEVPCELRDSLAEGVSWGQEGGEI